MQQMYGNGNQEEQEEVLDEEEEEEEEAESVVEVMTPTPENLFTWPGLNAIRAKLRSLPNKIGVWRLHWRAEALRRGYSKGHAQKCLDGLGCAGNRRRDTDEDTIIDCNGGRLC